MGYIASILMVSLILAVVTNTIRIFYFKNKSFIKSSLKKGKSFIKNRNLKDKSFERKNINWKLVFIELNKDLERYLYLDTYLKWKIWLYSFAFGYLIFMSTFNIQSKNQIFVAISLILLTVALVGIGDFIHSFNLEGIGKILFYLLKWFIFLIYPFTLLVLFLENIGRIDVLLVTVIVLLVYSFLFVKNIIDNFESYLFQFMNFIVILIFFNLFIIGLTFGAFYYENNDKYNYFSDEEMNNLLEYDAMFDGYDIAVITIKGIEPFFNFPKLSFVNNEKSNYIPIIEHLIGNIYLLLVIGFFVSYSVGVLIDRKNKK